MAGDEVDGATVLSAELIPSTARTYDLLPAGLTHSHWANGILLGSTLVAIERPQAAS